MSRETEQCWLTGQYTDMCYCGMCEHRFECSASNEDEDDDE